MLYCGAKDAMTPRLAESGHSGWDRSYGNVLHWVS
jgi:hypothetical protein